MSSSIYAIHVSPFESIAIEHPGPKPVSTVLSTVFSVNEVALLTLPTLANKLVCCMEAICGISSGPMVKLSTRGESPGPVGP